MNPDDQDLMDQIEDTLATLGVFDDSLRATLVREMRAALDADTERPAHVEVIDGGLHDGDEAEDDPPHDGRRMPRLEVFGREDAEARDDRIRVHVVRATTPDVVRRPRDLSSGHIRLPRDPDVWQTVLHGTRAAPYRIHCDDGEIQVAVDGEPVARLEEGQSVDVEGAVLRVRSCGVGAAVGRFSRLA